MTKECQHCHRQARYFVIVTDSETIDKYDEGFPKPLLREAWCLACIHDIGRKDSADNFEKSLRWDPSPDDIIIGSYKEYGS